MMDERAKLVRDLLTALPRTMEIQFGYLTHTGDATSFVREHVREAAARLGIDLGDVAEIERIDQRTQPKE